MAIDRQAILNQIDAVLQRCKELASASKYDDYSDLEEKDVSRIVNILFAAIERFAPPDRIYVKNANLYRELLTGTIGRAINPLIGILDALRDGYEAGLFASVVELVHSEVFADFLEMARYLIEQGYTGPAAVVAGSVLEEQLRKLCEKNNISTIQSEGLPKKADSLNSSLASANVYSKLDQKSVTAWLDLRNKAAHGKYAEYTKDQVALMIQGVRDFVSRVRL